MDRRLGLGGVVALLAGGLAAAWWWSGDTARTEWVWPATEGWQDTRTAPMADAAPSSAPNIVLVLGCTVRRDQLTPYGGHAQATPFLDRVAEQGVRFEDTIAAAPWTKASSLAMLTGRHAVAVDMVEPAEHRNHRVAPTWLPTLAERLTALGYDTVGTTANPNLNVAFGLSRGFARWHDSHGAVREEAGRGGHAVVKDLLAQIPEVRPERPLFVQLMLTDAHIPIQVSDDTRRMFAGKGTTKRVRTYRAALRELDDALAGLDSGLRQRGYTDDNTLFVFVADHGEGLKQPEHHRNAHGMTLYPSVTRVPWLMRGPGVAEGHVVTGLSSGVDVLPTLMGVAGLPLKPVEGLPDAPGRDWSALVAGDDVGTTRVRAWSDTWFHSVNRSSVWTTERQCQLDFGSRPGTATTHVDGCFDRVADPDLTVPIRDDALLDTLQSWRAAGVAAGAAARKAHGRVADATVDQDTIEQLRALGYAD